MRQQTGLIILCLLVLQLLLRDTELRLQHLHGVAAGAVNVRQILFLGACVTGIDSSGWPKPCAMQKGG